MSDEQNKLAVTAKPKRAPTLYFIVAIKLLKGLAALLLGALGSLYPATRALSLKPIEALRYE